MAEFGEVGSASVALRAEFDRLDRDLRRARTEVSRSGDRAGREYAEAFGASAKRRLAGAIAALVSVAALRQLTAGVSRAVERLDEIAKTADSIGITTDALQELRVAADLSGVSAGELDAGLRRFARGANEASQGVKEYKETFDRLGVSVTDTNGRLKPLDQLVNEVSDGFSKLDNATEKAALAQELFGRGGVRLVNLLNDGSEAINRMRKEARDLGLVIDEELIRKSEIANDRLSLIQQVIDTKVTVALGRLGPSLAAAGEGFVQFINIVADAQDALINFGKGFVEGIARTDVQNDLSRVERQIDDLVARREALLTPQQVGGRSGRVIEQELSLEALQEAAAIQLEINGLVSDQTELQARLAALQQLTNDASVGRATQSTPRTLPDLGGDDGDDRTGGGGGASRATQEIDERVKAFERLSERVQQTIQDEAILREEIGASIATIGLEDGAREDLIDTLEIERIQKEILTAAQQAANAGDTEAISNAQQLAAALGAVSAARIQDGQALREQQAAADEAAQAEERLADALKSTGDELIRAAFEGGNFLEILGRLIIKLLEMEAQAIATNAAAGGGGGGSILGKVIGGVLNAVGGAFGGGTGGFAPFDGGGVGAFFAEGGPVSGPGTGKSDSIPAMLSAGEFVVNAEATRNNMPLLEAINEGKQGLRLASGGLVGISRAALEAERGTGALIAGGSDQSTEMRAMRAGLSNVSSPGGGGGITVQMNINTPDVGGFRRSQSQISAEIGRMIRQGQSRQT